MRMRADEVTRRPSDLLADNAQHADGTFCDLAGRGHRGADIARCLRPHVDARHPVNYSHGTCGICGKPVEGEGFDGLCFACADACVLSWWRA
jgi:hypothetical protein